MKIVVGVSLLAVSFIVFAAAVLRRLLKDVELWIRRRGGTELVYAVDMSRHAVNLPFWLAETRDVVRRRLNAFGLRRVAVSTRGQDQIVARFAVTEPRAVAEVKRQLAVRGDLSLRLVAPEKDPVRIAACEAEEQAYFAADREWVRRKLAEPSFCELRPEPPRFLARPRVVRADSSEGGVGSSVKPGEKILLENPHVHVAKAEKWDSSGFIDIRHAKEVASAVDERTGTTAVVFELGPDRVQRFADLTGNNIGRPLAFVMNDTVYSVATIEERITGQVRLNGDFTDSEVRDLIVFLRTERLPTPNTLKLISERTLAPGNR